MEKCLVVYISWDYGRLSLVKGCLDGCYWFFLRIGGSVFYRILEKKKKLIDTGFSGFSGYLDKIVRGRELVFPDYWTPWLAGQLFIGCLDIWIDLLINQLLTQK